MYKNSFHALASSARRLIRYVAALSISLLIPAAFAGQANLAWDPSPDPTVTGYYVHSGQASHSYSSKVDVGNVTAFTVPGLNNGQTYYFAVTAYNAARTESTFSNEANKAIPASAPALVGLASSANPSPAGASVTFTATVQGTSPTGTVNFLADGSAISGCSAKSLTGSGNIRTTTCSTSSLATGTRSIVAHYNGDSNNGTADSSPFSQTIGAAAGVALVSSANPSPPGSVVTFTATVVGNAPTGTIQFTAQGSPISGCAAVALVGGGNTRSAICSTNGLAVGSHLIVANYGGDGSNPSSSSNAVAQSIFGSGGGEPMAPFTVMPLQNVALASNGGVASAPTALGYGAYVASINNGNQVENGWASPAGWLDTTPNPVPHEIIIDFSDRRSVDTVVIYSMQDNYNNLVTPTNTHDCDQVRNPGFPRRWLV